MGASLVFLLQSAVAKANTSTIKVLRRPVEFTLATTVGMVLGGALVVETIFNYPGVGTVLAGAVNDRDAPVVAGVVALTGVVITAGLVAADLLRSWSVRGRA